MASTKPIRVLSLFDGISCGRLALERAGLSVEKYYASEIDKYAIQISKRNWSDITHVGDVTKLDGSQFGKIDLLIGGSPCQSFTRSISTGFDGKSGLISEYFRLLKEVKPRWFLLENVVMRKDYEQQITQVLNVVPVMIDSALVSAQKRQRLYWTNIPFDRDITDKRISVKSILTTGIERKVINDNPLIISNVGGVIRVKNGTTQGYLDAYDGDCVNLEYPHSPTRRGRVSKGKTNTLNTACNYGYNDHGNLVELTITDYERLQTLPDGYTDGVSLTQRKKVIGNGWTCDVIAHILRGIHKTTE